MRHHLHIDLRKRTCRREPVEGEDLVKAGRYLIARTLVERAAAGVDPLSPDNPLIFSAGPFAGTNFSNANRTSVGCKSPLTGGIKESNAGGTFSIALGQLHLSGLTLHGAADEWVVIHITKDGSVSFDSAETYLGLGNFEVARRLHERYGTKLSIALCGPVGEYQGLLAGIAFSDTEHRPARLAARGGVGAVMGSKRVKAIVAATHKMPELHERKKFVRAAKEYVVRLRGDEIIDNYAKLGTAMMADYTNHIGGLPVRNFSSGRATDTARQVFKMGGDFIRDQNVARGGEHTHACMPGCMIRCSNVYVDADGNEIVSPVEYETIGLMGTNCGLTDPDDLARVNFLANDLGIDSIETGATLAVLMDAGVGPFGDIDFMLSALEDMRSGGERGRLFAQGTARVGAHYKVARVPVIKRQAISAYDPRVIEVTGITMMMTAQGADHTAGNVPRMLSHDKDVDELVAASLEAQIGAAAADSLGLCVFGKSVTNADLEFVANAVNAATGTSFTAGFFEELGRETLKLETVFNDQAGFTSDDDELPAFFYDEPLPPSNKAARFHGPDLKDSAARWWRRQI